MIIQITEVRKVLLDFNDAAVGFLSNFCLFPCFMLILNPPWPLPGTVMERDGRNVVNSLILCFSYFYCLDFNIEANYSN